MAFTVGEIYIFLVKLKSFLKEADLEICLSNVNLRIVKNRIFLQLGFVVVSTIELYSSEQIINVSKIQKEGKVNETPFPLRPQPFSCPNS